MKYSGRTFILQISDDGETWVSCLSDRSTSFTVGGEQVDTTDKGDAPWRVLGNHGVRSSSISCSGVVTDRASFATLVSATLNGSVIYARVIHGDAAEVIASGRFLLSSMERTGEHNNAESYSFALESANEAVLGTPPPPVSLVDEASWVGYWNFSGDSPDSVVTSGAPLSSVSQFIPVLAPISSAHIYIPVSGYYQVRAVAYDPVPAATVGARVTYGGRLKISQDLVTSASYAEASMRAVDSTTVRVAMHTTLSGAVQGDYNISLPSSDNRHYVLTIGADQELVTYIDGVKYHSGLYWPPAATKGGAEFYDNPSSSPSTLDDCFVISDTISDEAVAALYAGHAPSELGFLS